MSDKLDEKMVRAFPLLYRDRFGSIYSSCMPWGFPFSEKNPGWFNLIYELSSKLEPLIQKWIDENKPTNCANCNCDKNLHDLNGCFNLHYLPYSFQWKWKLLGWPSKANNWNDRWKIFKSKYIRYHLIEKVKRWISRTINFVLDDILHQRFRFTKVKPCWCTKFALNHPCASQVKEKFGCYDDQTEVLTKDGWKYFKDITLKDEIATLLANEFLEYQKPTDIISYKHSGDMYRLKTRGVDLLVTPNHNLYVAKGSYYNGRYSPPKKVNYPFELTTYEKYFGKNKRFKKTATWNRKDVENVIIPGYSYSADFVLTNKVVQNMSIEREYVKQDLQFNADSFFQLLGWYVAEGCSNSERGEVAIACNNTDNGAEKKIIKEVLENCNLKIKTSMEDKHAIVFKIYSKQLASWLFDNCGHNSYNKKIPQLVKDASARQIKLFLQSLFVGDGHETETAYILTTVSKQLSDDVQECLLKSGYTSRQYKVREEGTMISPSTKKECKTAKVYEINWLKHSDNHNTGSRPSQESIEQYDGMVYCVTVPEHVIYIRRNGIPVWCGNSLRFYMSSGTEEMFDLIDEYTNRSETICEVCGTKAELRSDHHWYSTLCETHAIDQNGNRIPTAKEVSEMSDGEYENFVEEGDNKQS